MVFCLTDTHRQGEFQHAFWNFWELLLGKMDKIEASCQEDNKTWHDRVVGLQTWLIPNESWLAGGMTVKVMTTAVSLRQQHEFYKVREKEKLRSLWSEIDSSGWSPFFEKKIYPFFEKRFKPQVEVSWAQVKDQKSLQALQQSHIRWAWK